jgi:FlaA1/EpsC-like NDP-sugar epimerase
MLAELLARVTSLSRPVKRLLQVTIDCALIASCLALAMVLRFDGVGVLSNPQVWSVLVPVTPLTIAAFIKLGLYRAVIRYITGRALRVVFLGVALSAAVMAASVAWLDLPIPGTVPAIYALLLFLSVGGIRFMARAMFNREKVGQRTPLLIYGAGEAGRQLVNALHQGGDYDPVAFVDDDRTLQGSSVGGLRVVSPARLPDLVAESKARTILLALPSIGRTRRREIIAALEPLGIEVKSIPGMADIVSGKARYSDLRTVTPEDLLGRDPIAPREDLMAANLTGKVVLVSGAGGSIGSELCRQILARNPRSLLLLDVSEYALYKINDEMRQAQADGTGADTWVVPVLGSVQNANRMRAILNAYGVQTIYHAAAFKHVPLVEENMVEGVRNNVFGTQTLAEAAAACGVENFILISTDKAVRPSNVMGATKRLAELICQALARSQSTTRFSMVRFGNVLGSSGSVIPRFRSQIERGGPVTVTHREISRYFMTIAEAAQLVIQAGAMARGGDVFVLDMGEPVRIFDLARSMIRLHGLEPYVIEAGEAAGPARGDIGIEITGLRKGEKLFEELLIGNNPAGTGHPRILTARESWVEMADLDRLLKRLMQACLDYDIPALRAVLIEAPLHYEPVDPEVSDLAWQASRGRGVLPVKPALRVIDGARKADERG